MKYNKRPHIDLFLNKCFHINGTAMNKHFQLDIDNDASYELAQFLTEINSKHTSLN